MHATCPSHFLKIKFNSNGFYGEQRSRKSLLYNLHMSLLHPRSTCSLPEYYFLKRPSFIFHPQSQTNFHNHTKQEVTLFYMDVLFYAVYNNYLIMLRSYLFSSFISYANPTSSTTFDISCFTLKVITCMSLTTFDISCFTLNVITCMSFWSAVAGLKVQFTRN
jgi:hypothetical protein